MCWRTRRWLQRVLQQVGRLPVVVIVACTSLGAGSSEHAHVRCIHQPYCNSSWTMLAQTAELNDVHAVKFERAVRTNSKEAERVEASLHRFAKHPGVEL